MRYNHNNLFLDAKDKSERSCVFTSFCFIGCWSRIVTTASLFLIVDLEDCLTFLVVESSGLDAFCSIFEFTNVSNIYYIYPAITYKI